MTWRNVSAKNNTNEHINYFQYYYSYCCRTQQSFIAFINNATWFSTSVDHHQAENTYLKQGGM